MRVVALIPLLASCVVHEATVVTLGATPGPNLVQMRTDPAIETASDLPHGALTSEATLVRADDSATCVDVMLRGDYQASAEVALEIDGALSRWQRTALPECRVDGPCLPADSHLKRFESDALPKVQPRAARVCFEGVLAARRAIVFHLRQGALERRFEFDVVRVASR